MITTIEIKCQKCGREVGEQTHEFNNGLCDPCFSMKRLGEQKDPAKELLAKRLERWAEICPSQYVENDTSTISGQAFNQVMAYKPRKRGLLCVGDSKRGKTTACWRLLEKIYTIDGIRFVGVTEPEFAQVTAKKSRLRCVDEWLLECCQVPLFFIDDIGHAASSSKHLEELYHVIEKRTAWQKPILATTQFTPRELTSKNYSGTAKTVIAILNRLIVSSEVVQF